jgi:8-oxo-dGTP pyrophosphatase MutT (NUDIX family)
MTEKSKTLYQGKIISLDVEQVELPNGVQTQMEIVRHPGGAAVVAIDDKQHTCLLKQYRYACDAWVWELPAGKIDDNEEPLLTAQRELQEEAGRRAAQWQSLGHMISSPGVFTEVVHCYLATELSVCDTEHEAEELIEIHWMPFEEAFERAIDNRINDAKSVIGLLRAQAFLSKDKN